MNECNDTISPDCQSAQELQVRLLTGESIPQNEQVSLASHLSTCAVCQTFKTEMSQLDGKLSAAFGALTVSSDFTTRTLAKLPAAEKPVIQAGPKVFTAAAPRHNSWLPRAAVAAVVLLTSGVAWVALKPAPEIAIPTPPKIAAFTPTVRKGELRDAAGQRVDKLVVGTTYSAAEESVLPLPTGTVKLQKGAEFMLQAGISGEPAVRLADGDLYAAGNAQAQPMRVVCDSFETELHGGNIYVAREPGAKSSVIIVFAGTVRVNSAERGTIALNAGEVFCTVTVKNGDQVKTVQLADMNKLRAQSVAGNSEKQRALYAKRVEAYQTELASLDRQLAETGKDAAVVADLKDRRQRVEGYLVTHRDRLMQMNMPGVEAELPLRLIDKGVNGYSDPVTWL